MKVRANLTQEETNDVILVLEKEVSGYSKLHVPERIVRLRSAIEKLKS